MRSRSATTFGRDAELRQLLAVADKARAGEAASVLVHGEAGVGKSRLVSDLVTALREQEALVFAGHGVHLSEGEVPFGVLTESLRDLVRTTGVEQVRAVLGPDAAHLAPLVPALRSGSRDEADRARVISATADLVEGLAVDRLVCWIVEDLQWTDSPTRDTFTYLNRFLPSVELLLVATWRDEDEGPPRPDGVIDAIGLSPLAGGDLDSLVAELAPDMEPRHRQRVADLSQGLPFLVEELVQSWRPDVGVDPAYLRRLVVTRLPGLSPSARALVELAAVGEGHLDVRLLEDSLGVHPAAIREAVAAGILDADAGAGLLRFRHALLREAIVDAVPPGDRRRLHRLWAEAIEADEAFLTGFTRVVALATHWHEADVPEKALPALAEAARVAKRVPAPIAEFGALATIAGYWDRVPDPIALTGFAHERLLVEAVRLGMNSGDYAAVVQLLDTERTRLKPEEDSIAGAWLRLRRSIFDDDFRHRDARQELATVETLLSAELDDPRLLDGLALLAGAGLLGDLELSARRRAELALAQLDEARDRVWASLVVASLQLRAGEFDHALATVRAHQTGLDGAPLDEQWIAAVNEAWSLYLLGSPAEAASILERQRARLSRPSAMAGMYQFLAENLTQAYVALGRWDEALALSSEALQAAPELPASDEVVLSADFLRLHAAEIHVARGDVGVARSTSELVRAHAGSSPWSDRTPPTWVMAELAKISAAEGDLTRCRSELAGAWDEHRPVQHEELPFAVLVALRAESDLVDRHDPRALAESAALVERIMAVAEPLARPGPRGTAWWAEARAHAARSRGGDTAADWAPAVAAWRACGQPDDVATCLRYLGDAALGDGDASAATEALAEAYEICEELGARPLAETILAVARRGRLPVGPAAVRSGPGPLTAREVEVLGLVAEGRSNQQIATELFMSPKTVSVHVSRILTKLDASNRTEAAATGRRLGLVD